MSNLKRIALCVCLCLLLLALFDRAQASNNNPGTNNDASNLTGTAPASVLPLATSTTAGAVKPGPNCSVDGSGALSCTATGATTLGTTLTGASPQIPSDATSGFYSAGAALIDAVISGVKIAEWASSGVTVTGTSTANSFIPTNSTVPSDGYYLPAANTSAIADRSLPVVYFTNPTSAVNYLKLSGAATGVAPTITVAGSDTNGTGLGMAFNALDATSTGSGGGINIKAGNSFGFANGANILITAGQSAGVQTGGTLTLKGGPAAASGAVGGQVVLQGGDTQASGAQTGVAIYGSSVTGSGTVAGGILIQGTANNPSGAHGGPITIKATNGANGGYNGGALSLFSGNGNTAGTAGALGITSGNGGTTSAGADISLTAGNGGSTSGNGGNIIFTPGAMTSGFAGVISLVGGIKHKRTTVADTAYSVLASDYEISYTSLSATRAVTVNCALGTSAQPQYFIVKDEAGSAGTNNITFTGTIDGASNNKISANYGAYKYYANGTSCFSW